MDALPVEILIKIFSYLNIKEQLAISEVSTGFSNVINSSIFLGNICVDLNDTTLLKNSMRHYINMKISNANTDKLMEINDLLENNFLLSATIKRIQIEEIELSDEHFLTGFLSKFGNIIELHLEAIHVKNATKISTALNTEFRHLKILKFFYCTNKLLSNFKRVHNQLKTFKICLLPHKSEKSRLKTFEIISKILSNNSGTLEKLNLYEVNFDDYFLNLISAIKLKRLKKFSMSLYSCITSQSAGFKKFILSQSETLEKFKIRTFDHINQDQLEILTKYVPKIKSLNLIICSNCDYEQFPYFKNLVKLSDLKITPKNYCSSIARHLGFCKFIETKVLNTRNEALLRLTFHMLYCVNEDVAKKIIYCFPNLEYLDLSYGIISNGNINLLKNKLKNIQQLILFHCEIICCNNI